MVHVLDCADDELYRKRDPRRVQLVEVEGVRTLLAVPLISEGTAIGSLCMFRREVRAYDPAQIALVETFAAQAIIAIENVRQFRELQEKLEREAATREILTVISQSRDDEGPVFDVILENAQQLCASPLTFLCLANEERSLVHLVANKGLSREWEEFIKIGVPIDSPHINVRAVTEGRVVHVPDMKADALYETGDEVRRKAVDEEGMRTMLAVPLISEGTAIGSLCVFRREARAFYPAQIALGRDLRRPGRHRDREG